MYKKLKYKIWKLFRADAKVEQCACYSYYDQDASLTTIMSAFMSLLWLIFVNMITESKVESYHLNGHANVSESPTDNSNYNINSMINYLERALQNLAATSVQQKETTKTDNAIGFTTKLSGTYNSSSGIIQGSTILYNGGNAYNGTVFTCPSPGLYLFHVTIYTNSELVGIYIYKNSQRLTLAYAVNADRHYSGASASAAVWLDVGDQVYLRSHQTSLSLSSDSAFTGVKVN